MSEPRPRPRASVPGVEVFDGYRTNLGHATGAELRAVDEAVFVRLAPDQLVELADLVAERLQADQAPAQPRDARCLVDASAVAAAIGMSAAWVREHGLELGGQRLGDGPRPRWRFDLQKAVAAWASRSASRSLSERSVTAEAAPTLGSRRRRARASASVPDLLPIRGDQEGLRAA